MGHSHRTIFLHRCLALLMMLSLGIFASPQLSSPVSTYKVYAVEYAVIPKFPTASFVAGADPSRRTDAAMMFWVIKGGGRIILFDSGFFRDRLIKQWKPKNFVKPSDALRRLAIKPGEVTDIIISHAHWDHAGSVELFPNASIWIQKDEYQYYTGESWQQDTTPDQNVQKGRRAANAKHGGIDPEDMLALVRANLAGRLRFVNGDDQEILPGIRCYIGGKHTFQSQFCSVSTRVGNVVLASDNVYLFENLEKHAAIAQTLDPVSNLHAQDRMKQIASRPGLIVPGHDPAVMERFPKVADRVVRID